jgi:hypothetical protein
MCGGEERCIQDGKSAFGKPIHRGRDCIKMDLHKVGWVAWTGSSWLRIGTVAGSCECGNELLGFVKCRKFVD